jgi:hypothetical protein
MIHKTGVQKDKIFDKLANKLIAKPKQEDD